jgi:hypothetical protein
MRMVITKRNYETIQAGSPGTAPLAISVDSYRERLFKYIPAEIVVLYVAVYGIAYAVFAADPLFSLAARWILIAGIVATPLYLWETEHVTDWVQLVISAFGFVLWACALGVVPVSSLPGYNQVAASLALPVYVFLSPLIEGIPDTW